MTSEKEKKWIVTKEGKEILKFCERMLPTINGVIENDGVLSEYKKYCRC